MPSHAKESLAQVKRQGAHIEEMQRRRLLSGMIEVLAEHGLEGASVGRICKRAGVSRRTFYDLFEDREDCFLATFELVIQRLTHRVAAAYTRPGHWRERVRAALTTLLECFEVEPALARLCVLETLKGGLLVLERRRQVLDALADAVGEGRSESKEGRSESKSMMPPSLTEEGIVGGVVAVIHARLVAGEAQPLLGLLNPLMSMIVHPYLGTAAARRELERPVPEGVMLPRSNGHVAVSASDPFKDLPIRLTFRTARVLATIGEHTGASNREVADAAGVADQGQMSKLLRRLEKAELIENHGQGQARGEPNAWRLTTHGQDVLHAVGGDDGK